VARFVLVHAPRPKSILTVLFPTEFSSGWEVSEAMSQGKRPAIRRGSPFAPFLPRLWHEDPHMRPSFRLVLEELDNAFGDLHPLVLPRSADRIGGGVIGETITPSVARSVARSGPNSRPSLPGASASASQTPNSHYQPLDVLLREIEAGDPSSAEASPFFPRRFFFLAVTHTPLSGSSPESQRPTNPLQSHSAREPGIR
jgi:hypothetical protein